MRRQLSGRAEGRRVFALAAMALWLFGTTATFAQGTSRGSARTTGSSAFPRLPGAVAKPPEWLVTGAPFDVAKYFAAPPSDRNAAPLYLDALFEFSGELTSCFPDSPDRVRRMEAARDRGKRYAALEEALGKDPQSVSPQAIDEVIALYEPGFRKLAQAQRRDLCVFETGLGFTALLPHVQAARQVTRIASLRVRRALERRNVDGAVHDVEMVLRLCHDLKPRGVTICQLVVVAVIQLVGTDMMPPILASPGLRPAHCDRLLKAFVALETNYGDGYLEATKAEYLTMRVALRDLVQKQAELAKQLGIPPGASVLKAIATMMGPDAPALPADVDAQIAKTPPAELARADAAVAAYFRALLRLDGVPYVKRIEQIATLKVAEADDALSLAMRMLAPPYTRAAVALARASATVHAMECLIALRRWQLSHRGTPRDLPTTIKGTVLKAVPTDPYDGKPLRLATLKGETIVYSIGKDGKDDGGEKDADRDQRPGDLIYRLPPTATNRR
jgi:hypothetical protein